MDTNEPIKKNPEVAAGGDPSPAYAGGAVPGGDPSPAYAGGAVPGGDPSPAYAGGAVPGGVPPPMYAGGAVPGGVPPPMYAGGSVPGGPPHMYAGGPVPGGPPHMYAAGPVPGGPPHMYAGGPVPGGPPHMYAGGPVPAGAPPLVHQLPANVLYTQPTYPQYAANYPSYPQGQNMVVTTQPMMTVPGSQVYEKDYMGFSIFTLLFCCLPLGIAALIYSCSTQSANERGDTVRAKENSRMARMLNNWALGIGIIFTIAWVAYVIYINVAFNNYRRNYYG
ncbi:hypothetical protein NDU88_010753 [Pleurodeles waltl]|uniref:Uncharacterized protein n=1 Tax=Pleurodeles waltl TaxID=8319 RepID=A0AAV7Q357_PLEWA|nr:hypothetical protein NDU88_010753 [Pleurodeles waltl]